MTVVGRTVESKSSREASKYRREPPASQTIGANHRRLVMAMTTAPTISGVQRRIPAQAIPTQRGNRRGRSDWRTPPATPRARADQRTKRARPQRAGQVAGYGVGVDIEGAAVGAGGDRRDHGGVALGEQHLEGPQIETLDVADQTELLVAQAGLDHAAVEAV